MTYDEELQLHQSDKIPAFEGWYFRVVDHRISIAVIIGIAKTEEKQEVFIQVFHTLSHFMEKVSYDLQCFQYQKDPFLVKIKQSVFKRYSIHIEDPNLMTYLDLEFKEPLHLKQTKYAPTIMGPFAYLKKMQCQHAILNLGSQVLGQLKYQEQNNVIQGVIYQEKDWGNSFPKRYVWLQSNCCIQKNAVLFLSCATIPLKFIHFTGVIMVLVIEGKLYHFGSYYGAVLVKAKKTGDQYVLVIRQGKYKIELEFKIGTTYVLDAPEKGNMLRNVEESLLGQVELKLYKYHRCKERLSFAYCGIENDHFFK